MKKGDKYSCIRTGGSGIEDDAGDFEITMKTEKQMELTMIRKPFFSHGWYKFRVKFDNKCSHKINLWDDDTFTIYFNRSGIPFYFEPLKEN